MKNFIFAISCIFFANYSSAQASSKPNTPQTNTPNNVGANNSAINNQTPVANTQTSTAPYLKQKKEEITIEGILQFQFMNSPLGIKFDELKVRYFVSEKLAYRARGLVNMYNNNETINDSIGKKANIIQGKQYLSLGFGIEEHLKSKNNISPYWGGEVLFSLAAVKLDGTNTANAKTVKEGYKIHSENTEYGFYVGAVAGIDYYLNSNFYIGTEIRYGYQSINLGNVSNTVYAPNGLISTSGESLGTNTKLDMSYTQGIRIGFKF
jgi:hypothetical protein